VRFVLGETVPEIPLFFMGFRHFIILLTNIIKRLMDLETFIRNTDLEPGDRIGIYCVSPNLLPKPFDRVFRCGAAGTREVITNGGSLSASNFRSRMAMYFSNWIQGGTLHFCLTVPRSVYLGYTMKIPDENLHALDARPLIAQPGSTMLQHVERKYHRAVEAQGLERVRPGRAEWFEGDLELIEKAMRSIGSGTFYRFENNRVVLKERLRGGKLPKTVKAKHRRSPRDLRATNEKIIVRPAKGSSESLRKTLANPRVAASIAELVSMDDSVQRIRITRSAKAIAPVSSRTRSSV